MKRKTLRFRSPKDLDPRGSHRGRKIRFPFSIVDSDLVDSPEEEQKTTQHELDVDISDMRRASWNLNDDDLVKVLFEIGKKELKERLTQGDIPDQVSVVVSTTTHSVKCPYNPGRIVDPDGAVIEIEIPSRIGFR
jgi:hypothetical protein